MEPVIATSSNVLTNVWVYSVGVFQSVQVATAGVLDGTVSVAKTLIGA